MTAEIAEIEVELSRIGREIRADERRKQQFRRALLTLQFFGLALLGALAWKAGEWFAR